MTETAEAPPVPEHYASLTAGQRRALATVYRAFAGHPRLLEFLTIGGRDIAEVAARLEPDAERPRLHPGPGGLRGLVHQHLRSIDGKPTTPHAIAQAVPDGGKPRSWQAVRVACDRLVDLGHAELVSARPLTYRAAGEASA
jgi:hypothetical protein